MSLRTKLDLCRQVYQNCGCYMHLSGSTQIEQSLQVMLSAGTEVYGFTVSATTGNTVVVAIGQNPSTISASGLQINPDIIPIDGGVTPDLGINITTGEITRDASSLRYKKNIQNLPYNDYKNILNLNPVKFKWKNSNIEGIGLIAEELHELGLKDFVIYNAKGEPDGISYKLLTVAIIGLLRNGIEVPSVTPQISEPIEDIPIIITDDYTTKTTRYIIAKKDDITITLDDTNFKRFYIKSMAEITVIPTKGLIDEEWEEISMGPQSSIELIAYEGNWYVLSSDGLKNS